MNPQNLKSQTQQNTSDIVNYQSGIVGDTKREDFNQFDSQLDNQQNKNNSTIKNNNSSVMQSSQNSPILTQQNLPPIQKLLLQQISFSNNTNDIGNSNNNNNLIYHHASLHESTSLNSNVIAKNENNSLIGENTTLMNQNKNSQKRNSDHFGSQKRGTVDISEIELESIRNDYLVRTKEQLQNGENQKFLFLCKNDSSKSFIMQVPHTQAQQPGSTQELLEKAQIHIKMTFGKDPVSLELIFGMHNKLNSLNYHSDCFPAYFKIKEIFEESYTISVQLPLSTKNQGPLAFALLSVFPSMTVEDAKKELSIKDPNINMYACSMFRMISEDQSTKGSNPNSMASPMNSKLQLRSMPTTSINGFVLSGISSSGAPIWIPLLDEDKFGLNAYDSSQFVIVNSEEELLEVYWPETEDSINQGEVKLIQNSDAHRRIGIGINLEIECKNSLCKLQSTKQVKQIGVGLFDLLENFHIACPSCKSNQHTQIHQIAFFQCRSAFTGINDNKKKSSAKWTVSYQPLLMKKLDQKEILNKLTHINQTWDKFLDSNTWTRFKIYAKRISNFNRLEENEELLHYLEMEDVSTHKLCGVCKQNVSDHMQHTLECGHSFHKICLNLLPSIFASLRCPVCVNYSFHTNIQQYMGGYHFIINFVLQSTRILQKNEKLFNLQILKKYDLPFLKMKNRCDNI